MAKPRTRAAAPKRARSTPEAPTEAPDASAPDRQRVLARVPLELVAALDAHVARINGNPQRLGRVSRNDVVVLALRAGLAALDADSPDTAVKVSTVARVTSGSTDGGQR
jgi:hypothetical protein